MIRRFRQWRQQRQARRAQAWLDEFYAWCPSWRGLSDAEVDATFAELEADMAASAARRGEKWS